MLACADVLGALKHHPPEDTGLFEFTDEALVWIRETHDSTEGHLKYLDTAEEGPLDYTARQAYLAHVTDRILAANGDREAVTV